MTTNEFKPDRNSPKAYFSELTVKQACYIFWTVFFIALSALPLIFGLWN